MKFSPEISLSAIALRIFIFSVAVTLLSASPYMAQPDSIKARLAKRIYNVMQLKGPAPVIDGRLDDPCWLNNNTWQSDFTQREPHDGARPTQKTSFCIQYDENNLYVAIRCYDTEPNKIDRTSARRDVLEGDIAGFSIDSYFDHRTGFEFDLTAAGGKIDALPLNGGTSWDLDWDAVWQGKTGMEDSAWVAEMCVPFSQFRFGEKDTHTFGLHVWRWINRLHEESDWQYIPMDSPGIVHLFGEMHGIHGIKTPKRIELLPYMLGKLHTSMKEDGNPFATGHTQHVTAGLDGKIGLTSDLTLNFTVNPDFGQVEADPSVMNLSAFEVFYAEKRPFFVEGKNILNMQVNDDLMFYSRRIGQSPHYIPPTGMGEYLKMPDNTSILSALKVSGKTQDGWSVGALQSFTAQEKAEIRSPEGERNEIVEPFTSYFAGRVQKDFNDGSTIMGGIITAVNRNLNSENLSFLPRGAYNGGFDFRHRWNNKTWAFDFKGMFSHITGDKKAMLLLQKSPAHYFQRPDNYSLDENRQTMTGHGGSIAIGKEGGGSWRLSAGFSWRSPMLELNDLGYMRMADLMKHTSTLGYVVNTPAGLLRNYTAYLDQAYDWDFKGRHLQSVITARFGVQFINNWGVSYRIARNTGALDNRLLRGGPAFRKEGLWNNTYSFYTDRSRDFELEFSGSANFSDDKLSRFLDYSPALVLKVNKAFIVRTDVSYDLNLDDMQYLETGIKGNERIYLAGRLHQKTLGVSLRLDYYITPELSVQYYANPYISSGNYSDFKRVTSPQAEGYESRFQAIGNDEIRFDPASNRYTVDENRDGLADYTIRKPDFTFREFRSNLVIRWEYKTGSVFYLVWSQGRTAYEGVDNFSVSDLISAHSDIYPDNIFLLKFNHWFSF